GSERAGGVPVPRSITEIDRAARVAALDTTQEVGETAAWHGKQPASIEAQFPSGASTTWTGPEIRGVRNATSSVFHQRHLGRVLRSPCRGGGRRTASSRG